MSRNPRTVNENPKNFQSRVLLLGILVGVLAGTLTGVFVILRPRESDDRSTPGHSADRAIHAEPSPRAGDGPPIRDITTNATEYANGEIPRYEKFEVTFQVDSAAQNFQLPYDPTPPAGIEPGIGISVAALFTPDNWRTVFIQPAFYYQEFQDEIKSGKGWLYPTENRSWKIRFSPHQEGNWQFKLIAQDASGIYETPTFALSVVPSENKGFIRVTEADPRYFEYEDGTYFPGLGYNFDIPADEDTFRIMSENGIQLIRTWMPSQLSIFGSAWSPWLSFGAAPWPSEPNARLRHDTVPPFNLTPSVDPPIARPESEVFLWLSHNETVSDDGKQWGFVPCVVWGWQTPQLPVKRDTDYRIRIRHKEQDLTGPKVPGRPYGFAVKTGGWLWHEADETRRCYYPDTGTILAATHYTADNWSLYPDPENPGWQILEGRFNSGDTDFLDDLYLAIENATSGYVFVDYVWLEEDLGNGQYGPNVIYKPWMAHHLYFDQRNSYVFDKTLNRAERYGIYFKLVILEKNDYVLNIFEPDGSLSPYLPHQNPQKLLLGEGRETDGKTKTRWLLEAWWRYLQARWGYSPNIHSWELLNEGDPNDSQYYVLADELGRYFQQAFISEGQRTKHPNWHLVTTSFWHSFPNSFWSSEEYPYVDYADVHHYARESDTYPLDHIYDVSDFYDAALFSQKLSMYHGAKQPNGPGKPVMRGESGFFFDGPDLFSQNATNGVWLHNMIWAGINSGGLLESYWTGGSFLSRIYKDGSHDHRPMFRAYYNFISNIPLNNGHYEDAAPVSSHPDLRAWGQKDVAHGRAHLWIQNKNHTWRNVIDGISIPAASGTVTIAGFEPGQSYIVEWWDPYQPDPTLQVIGAETAVAQPDGSITITVDSLTTDLAVKVSSP